MISEVWGADLFFRIGGLNLKLPKDPRYKMIEFILCHQKELKKYSKDKEAVIDKTIIPNPKEWLRMVEVLKTKLSIEQIEILRVRYMHNESYIKTSRRLHISERTYINLLTDIRRMAYMIAIELGLVSVIRDS